jgi:hypothetical protein
MLLDLIFDVLPRFPRIEAALYALQGVTVEDIDALFNDDPEEAPDAE